MTNVPQTDPSGLDRYASRGVAITGLAVGLTCFAYYYGQGLTTAHYDAKAHLLVARRIIDSPTPGYIQMGSHWLPLTHLLYVPFVAFASQYRTGFFPSLLSVCAFALSAWLTLRISSRATGSTLAGIFAGLVLIGNANLEYLQSCPLTEPLFMVFLLLAVDGLVRWRDADGAGLPWLPAVWVSLGCMCRYEGWYLLAGIILLLGWDSFTGRLARGNGVRAILLFALMFALPAAIHFGYLYLRVHDSFLLRVVQGNPAPYETFKRPILSLAYHLGELAQIAAVVPLIAGFAGVVYCLEDRERRRRCAPLFLLWVPSLINVSALYWGMIYRVRYSVLLLPAIVVFASLPLVAEKASRLVLLLTGITVMFLPWISRAFPHEWKYHDLYPGPGMLFLPVAAAVLILAALATGRYRFSLLILCVLGMQIPVLAGESRPILGETLEHSYFEPERQLVLKELRQNYDGRRILIDSLKLAPLIYDSGLPVKDFVYNEGDRSLWGRAMNAPETEAGWLCALKGDEVWQRLHVDPQWADRYALVSQTENLLLYRLKPGNR